MTRKLEEPHVISILRTVAPIVETGSFSSAFVPFYACLDEDILRGLHDVSFPADLGIRSVLNGQKTKLSRC